MICEKILTKQKTKTQTNVLLTYYVMFINLYYVMSLGIIRLVPSDSKCQNLKRVDILFLNFKQKMLLFEERVAYIKTPVNGPQEVVQSAKAMLN
jgi:hypothetical protein